MTARTSEIKKLAVIVLLAGLFIAGPLSVLQAQIGTLAEPFSPPSPNAALHYQRALLLLSALDEADHNLLQKNVWEILPDSQPVKGRASRIKRLLYRARHAADAAGKGSRLQTCDFGIDFADAGAATVLPHVEPMVELGRLLALRGAYAQSQGNWEEAAVIYFDGLRMGRHLTHQPTLLEAMAGMQIQENNYYALAHWAADCPDADVVARVFGLFEIMADGLIDPARTLASETSILALDYQYLERNYPDGLWGAAILRSLGKATTDDEQENRRLAASACVEAGVPEEVFDKATSFRKYLATLKELDLRFADAAASAMKLPPQARVKRGQRLYDRYIKAVGAIGEQSLLNPAEIGALFAGHEAKTTLLRVALAAAARRTDRGFPQKLDDVASGFGGTVPTSPYDGSPIEYELLDNGKSFRLELDEFRVAGVVLPQVEFSSASPAAARE